MITKNNESVEHRVKNEAISSILIEVCLSQLFKNNYNLKAEQLAADALVKKAIHEGFVADFYKDDINILSLEIVNLCDALICSYKDIVCIKVFNISLKKTEALYVSQVERIFKAIIESSEDTKDLSDYAFVLAKIHYRIALMNSPSDFAKQTEFNTFSTKIASK